MEVSSQHVAPLARVFAWDLPSKAGAIHLNLDVVERLSAAIRNGFDSRAQRPPEIGGLLLGRSETSDEYWTTTVEDFEPLPCEHARGPSYTLSGKDRKALESRIRHAGGAKGLTVVGFYRTHTRPGLFLDQDDFALMNDSFSHPAQVALVVKPSSTEMTAGFFVWEEGDIRRQSPYAPFPFDRVRLVAGDRVTKGPEQRKAAPVRYDAAAAVEASAPPAGSAFALPLMPEVLDQVRVRVRPWLLVPVVAAAVLAVGWLAARKAWQSPPEPQAAHSTSLALRVEKSGDGLRLIWDHTAEPARKATAASVLITDGAAHYRLELNQRQVTLGSIIYFPTSADVSFELELLGTGAKHSEMVRAFAPAAAQAPPARDLLSELPPMPAPLATEPVAAPPAAPGNGVAYRRARQPWAAARKNASPVRPQKRLVVKATTPVAAPTIDAPPDLLVASVGKPSSALPQAPLHREATVSLAPARPSGISRVIGRIPLVRGLQRDGGKNFIPPQPIRQVRPVIPARTQPAAVDLKVEIDDKGWVRRTEVVSRGPEPAMARLAANAAREWRFAPALMNGKPVASELVLHFRFSK